MTHHVKSAKNQAKTILLEPFKLYVCQENILKSASRISTAEEERHFRRFLVPLHTVKQQKVAPFFHIKGCLQHSFIKTCHCDINS